MKDPVANPNGAVALAGDIQRVHGPVRMKDTGRPLTPLTERGEFDRFGQRQHNKALLKLVGYYFIDQYITYLMKNQLPK